MEKEKEGWFQRWKTKKRFWGSVAMTVGGLLQLIPYPPIMVAGTFLIKGGGVLLSAGLIDKADRDKKERKAEEEADKQFNLDQSGQK